jgi:hypothetical protein
LPPKFYFKFEYAGNLYKSKFEKPEVVSEKDKDDLYDPKIEWLTECKGVGKKLIDAGEEEKNNADGRMCFMRFESIIRDMDLAVDKKKVSDEKFNTWKPFEYFVDTNPETFPTKVKSDDAGQKYDAPNMPIGFDIGVAAMKLGEKAEIHVKHWKGFGKLGDAGHKNDVIPAYTHLVYTVHLLKCGG